MPEAPWLLVVSLVTGGVVSPGLMLMASGNHPIVGWSHCGMRDLLPRQHVEGETLGVVLGEDNDLFLPPRQQSTELVLG